MPSKISFFYKLIAIINLFSIACCAEYSIVDQERLGSAYTKGKIFIAQKDLVLDESGVLVDDDLTIRGIEKGRMPKWFKGLISKGERVKITRVLFKQHPDIGDSIHPIGVLLDGKLKGEEVDMYLVSKILEHVITKRSRYAILTNDVKRFIECK